MASAGQENATLRSQIVTRLADERALWLSRIRSGGVVHIPAAVHHRHRAEIIAALWEHQAVIIVEHEVTEERRDMIVEENSFRLPR